MRTVRNGSPFCILRGEFPKAGWLSAHFELHKSLANIKTVLYNSIKNSRNFIYFSEKEARLWIIAM